MVSFQVPNESTTGAATTALTVDLTNVSAVRTEAKPGWTAKTRPRRGSGTVRSVTWTAAPNGGIAVDQFGLFRISVKLPDADSVSFPATQTYADGAVVKWDQPSAPGEPEPEHPAPTLILAGGSTPPPGITQPRRLSRADRHGRAGSNSRRRPTTPPGCWLAPPCWSARSALVSR